jgi:hypothetical protein
VRTGGPAQPRAAASASGHCPSGMALTTGRVALEPYPPASNPDIPPPCRGPGADFGCADSCDDVRGPTVHAGRVNAVGGADELVWKLRICRGHSCSISLSSAPRRRPTAGSARQTRAKTGSAPGRGLTPNAVKSAARFGTGRRSRRSSPANPPNQSRSGSWPGSPGGLTRPGMVARAALLTGLAGIAIAARAHQRGHRLARVVCYSITGGPGQVMPGSFRAKTERPDTARATRPSFGTTRSASRRSSLITSGSSRAWR